MLSADSATAEVEATSAIITQRLRDMRSMLSVNLAQGSATLEHLCTYERPGAASGGTPPRKRIWPAHC